MLEKNPHMLLEILGHSKMEQISIATDIYLVHLHRASFEFIKIESFNEAVY